jgi:hypothetical protein
MLIVALFTKVKTQNQTKSPSIHQWIKKSVVHVKQWNIIQP